MATRQEVQAKMEATLAKGEETVDSLKAKVAAAGDSASEESKEALAEAEKMLASGKQKYEELADATDDQFDELMAKAKDTWDDLSDQVESGWATASEKIKSLFT